LRVRVDFLKGVCGNTELTSDLREAIPPSTEISGFLAKFL